MLCTGIEGHFVPGWTEFCPRMERVFALEQRCFQGLGVLPGCSQSVLSPGALVMMVIVMKVMRVMRVMRVMKVMMVMRVMLMMKVMMMMLVMKVMMVVVLQPPRTSLGCAG